MVSCPSCGAGVAAQSRFCSACGHPLGPETGTSAPTRVPAPPSGPPSASPSDPSSGARFLPGVVLAERYRIVGMLGRGGMGEVYRADDLKLGQAVALKWLPRDVESDPSRLERFLGEVRHSLRVTHPNVCRVFDVGETGGQHFLSMEYVDGEDLASLLRRIGRLPHDKATQVARQLCAGLAAAHDEGVLHRDLKPANVMLDGRGRAKITDFGLAGAIEGIEGAEARAGTPGYMAPEQLAGERLTRRTDIYALGLVLYELYTGKRAYEAESVAELARLQRETTPSSLSSHVETIDPLVERVILRCLAADPEERPASAHAVAAALPGGDPLAAAIAAGETPSPEMVAAAGGRGGLTPPVAWGLLGVALVTMAAGLAASAPRMLTDRLQPERPPAVLADRARELLRATDRFDPDANAAHGLAVNHAALEWARGRAEETDWYDATARDLPWFGFWYRQRDGVLSSDVSYGYTTFVQPPMIVPGEVRVMLDHDARLLWFERVPDPETDLEPGAAERHEAAETSWAPLFDAAGLDPACFEPVEPRHLPRTFADRRFAWEGSCEAADGAVRRVEAASLAGRPVLFRVEDPWRVERDETDGSESNGEGRGILWFGLLMIVAVTAGTCYLVRRNLRSGRSDLRGANTLAAIYIALHTVSILPVLQLSLGHLPGQVAQMLSLAGFQAAILWAAYLGLEPIVRRRWPSVLVSWSRLLKGGLFDPLVGRDVLIGCAAGAVLFLLPVARWWIERALDAGPLPVGIAANPFAMSDAVSPFAALLHMPLHILEGAMVLMLLFVLLTIGLKRTIVALLAATLVVTVPVYFANPESLSTVVVAMITTAAWLGLILRVGFLAGAVASIVRFMTEVLCFSVDFGRWYATAPLVFLVAFVLLAGFGFWTALAGRSMFGSTAAD